MRIAKGTSPWLAIAWALALIFLALAIALSPWLWALAVPMLVVALLLLNFFRDPERTIGQGIISPADGVIHRIDEPEGPNGRRRIAVFMNPLDVHVNRAPMDARTLKVEHVKGGFIPAFNKDSERNERVVWDLQTAIGEVRMVQIAGAVARRILPYVGAGVDVKKGERVGIIRLGSRVDLYLPRNVTIVVNVGDRVRAGETTLANVP